MECSKDVSTAVLTEQPPWRNWLARSAVNRKVGGSSPPGGANFFAIFDKLFLFYQLKRVDLGRTRTCNPLIRSQMPYPFGHKASHRCRHDQMQDIKAVFQLGSLVLGYDSRLGCERSRVQIPDEPACNFVIFFCCCPILPLVF